MTNELMGYVPPHSFEAEQSVLGGLMLRSDAYHDLNLSEQDFYSRPHRIIYSAIASLMAARQPVDLMTLNARIEEDGGIEEIGGMPYLIELAKNTPSAANVVTYGSIVRQMSERRFAIGKLQDAIEAMMEPGFSSTDERFSAMGALISEIETKRAGGVVGLAVPASEIVKEWCDLMEERLTRKPGEVTGFTTGIQGLDELLYPTGISKSALIAVGARPKMGKTTFLAAVCNHVALVRKQPVLAFSLEMTKVELLEVMLSQAAGVSGTDLHSASDQSKMDKAYAVIAELGMSKLHIADQPSMSLQQICAEARRLRREFGQIGMVAVDYLTLMKAEKAERNDLAYGNITKGLKNLAKELQCPVLMLTQLNRELEKRADKRPMPSDSRDTGQIEQDCNIWIGLYRDEVYNEQSPLAGLMEMIVRLHRGGSTGTAYASFGKGVMGSISQDEVARRTHLAEMDSAKGKGKKGGWDD
ncbi:replicative DNA helicase [Aeromonas sp. RU39B]|uniref:replicative DNA helicase n=1 Tax=Aeromonas sp. RU39B TaxID=1907416 RepID=UPI000954E01C|nr:replicative DNA helicase [Aeromonas sp. RU39B]SIR39323.1 replicative DNA helicase [Aeromonas sp. RU39B]